MKNITVLTLAIIGVIVMIYAGFNAMTNNYSYGPFMMFIGVCTAVGLSIDLFNVIQGWVRKSKVSKLGRY